jgi:hypothetical protein
MTRPRGGIIGAKPTWTTTATSGIWTLRQAEEMQADGKWPRGPEAPTSLAGTGADTEVALTWVAPATTHGTITNYAVEYTPSGGSPTVVLTGSTAASYTVTGLTNDTEYTFRVAGVNHTRGDWSDSVAVTPGAASGWSLTNAAYVQNFSVSAQESNVCGVSFKTDGTKMYIIGYSGDDVNEYNLSTAWDISTASYLQNFSVSGQDSTPFQVIFKDDGTKMYMLGLDGKDINEYTLSTAWNVTTASFVHSFVMDSQDGSPRGIAFGDSGTKLYMSGQNTDKVFEYSLSSAWNVSTASYVRDFSVAAQGKPTGIAFSTNGDKLFVLSASADAVFEYDLSTPWNISTLSYVQSFSVSTEELSPFGLAFKTDGTRMYVSGDAGDDVNEYSLGAASDPDFASVSLLLHMDGSNGSTTFTDSSGNAFTATTSGNVQISTAESKFGTASALFDGTDDVLSFASNAVFNFGTGDFTVEAWVYLNNINKEQAVAAKWGSSGNAWLFRLETNNRLKLFAGSSSVTGSSPLSASTWHHVAVTRSSGITRLFLDGVQNGITTINDNLIGTTPVTVGAYDPFGTEFVNDFDGYIDDLRITKGVARYTANFTAPTAAFPDQ